MKSQQKMTQAETMISRLSALNQHSEAMTAVTDKLGTRVVWVASYGWRDCDPIATVIGNYADKVERVVMASMREEAVRAYQTSDESRSIQSWQNDLYWTGVSEWQLLDFANELETAEADDVEALVEGVRGAIVVITR